MIAWHPYQNEIPFIALWEWRQKSGNVQLQVLNLENGCNLVPRDLAFGKSILRVRRHPNCRTKTWNDWIIYWPWCSWCFVVQRGYEECYDLNSPNIITSCLFINLSQEYRCNWEVFPKSYRFLCYQCHHLDHEGLDLFSTMLCIILSIRSGQKKKSYSSSADNKSPQNHKCFTVHLRWSN